MPSHITVVPASSRAGKEAIRLLLESKENPSVRGIYRDPSKAPTEFTGHPSFEAVKGDVSSGSDLNFENSNAVFYIPPPTYDGTKNSDFATLAATNVANALKKAPNVKKLVLHSSLGAQYSHSTGIIALNHVSDRILEAVVPEVIIVRPGLYFQNWTTALQTMQGDPPHFESAVSPAEYKIPMVSVNDVAKYCAEALLDKSSRPSPQYVKLQGPRLYSSLELQDAIETVTGKKGKLVIIEKEELEAFWAKIVPEGNVQELVDFCTCQLGDGILAGDYEYDEDTVRCETELVDGLRIMASE